MVTLEYLSLSKLREAYLQSLTLQILGILGYFIPCMGAFFVIILLYDTKDGLSSVGITVQGLLLVTVLLNGYICVCCRSILAKYYFRIYAIISLINLLFMTIIVSPIFIVFSIIFAIIYRITYNPLLFASNQSPQQIKLAYKRLKSGDILTHEELSKIQSPISVFQQNLDQTEFH